MARVGLVLEGGAMRGMYSAGVLDVLMDYNIEVDGIIGTSAGALFGVNYYSKQRGRVIRYNKRFCKDRRYISKISFLLTGNIVNRRFAYYNVTKKYDIFDNETFLKNNKEYFATVTNVNTGEAEYIKITDPLKQMEVLRASAAMPVVSKMVKIGDKKYLDGGVSDSIPFEKFLEKGYDKIIVVLTQPEDYRKKQLNAKKIKIIKTKYKKYPKLVEAMLKRSEKYNEALEKINSLESSGKIFVIKPTEKIDINVIERDGNRLQAVYDLGVSDGRKRIEQLKAYLKKIIFLQKVE